MFWKVLVIKNIVDISKKSENIVDISKKSENIHPLLFIHYYLFILIYLVMLGKVIRLSAFFCFVYFSENGRTSDIYHSEKRITSSCAVDLDRDSMTRELSWIFLQMLHIVNECTLPFSLSAVQTQNVGKNTCRLFHFLTQLLFTTSGTELDYYPHKINEKIASRYTE